VKASDPFCAKRLHHAGAAKKTNKQTRSEARMRAKPPLINPQERVNTQTNLWRLQSDVNPGKFRVKNLLPEK